MSFLEIEHSNKHSIEIKLPKIITFKSIDKNQPLEELTTAQKEKILKVTIDCKNTQEIDSCGLAIISHIEKLFPKAKVKILAASSKIEKLQKLYLTTKDTYEDRNE